MTEQTPEVRRPGRPVNPVSRAKLLNAAKQLFAARGFSAASLSEIAAAAGLRKSSLYHHFATKEALYIAVLEKLSGDIRDLFIAVQQEAGSYSQRLEQVTNRVFDYLENNVEAAQILARDMLNEGPFMRQQGRQAFRETLTLGAAFLEEGMNAGEFRPQDAKQLILSLVGLCLYTFATGKSSDRFLGAPGVTNRRQTLWPPIRALCLQPPAAENQAQASVG